MLQLPHENDRLVSELFQDSGLGETAIASLNCCRICLEVIFLSDMVTANGKCVEEYLLLPQPQSQGRSRFTFPKEKPTVEDWKQWHSFWNAHTGSGFSLPIPLGKWLNHSHRCWEWYYDEGNDVVQRVEGSSISFYHPSSPTPRTRSSQIYIKLRTETNAVPLSLPVSVTVPSDTAICKLESGPPLCVPISCPQDFWSYLWLLGGDCMWEHIEHEDQDISWLVKATRCGSAVMVTDGSFDRKRAPLISGAGWEITCRKARTFLKGSFFEISTSASAYRGGLLGLVALHTPIYAITQYYKLEKAHGRYAVITYQPSTSQRIGGKGSRMGPNKLICCVPVALSSSTLCFTARMSTSTLT